MREFKERRGEDEDASQESQGCARSFLSKRERKRERNILHVCARQIENELRIEGILGIKWHVIETWRRNDY